MWKKENPANKNASTGDNGQGSDQSLQAPGAGMENVIAFVGKGVEFKGTITYDGTVRIDGHLDGEIHTDGILLVGEDAVITAKVSAGTVISRGKITGDIIAKDGVKLESPAELNGSVKAPKLSIEEGVLFNGTCEMALAEVRELPRESIMRAVGSPGSSVKRA
jgi:cytoskeletal protein CcmA (bactofilin family)